MREKNETQIRSLIPIIQASKTRSLCMDCREDLRGWILNEFLKFGRNQLY